MNSQERMEGFNVQTEVDILFALVVVLAVVGYFASFEAMEVDQ